MHSLCNMVYPKHDAAQQMPTTNLHNFPAPQCQDLGKYNKKRLSQTSPYKTGTGEAMVSARGTSIAPVKPAHLDNETLVIAGCNRDLTKEKK